MVHRIRNLSRQQVINLFATKNRPIISTPILHLDEPFTIKIDNTLNYYNYHKKSEIINIHNVSNEKDYYFAITIKAEKIVDSTNVLYKKLKAKEPFHFQVIHKDTYKPLNVLEYKTLTFNLYPGTEIKGFKPNPNMVDRYKQDGLTLTIDLIERNQTDLKGPHAGKIFTTTIILETGIEEKYTFTIWKYQGENINENQILFNYIFCNIISTFIFLQKRFRRFRKSRN